MSDDEAYQKGLKKAEKMNEQGYGTHYECCNQSFDNRADLTKHLAEAHNIDTKTQKFNRQMLMHLDGRDWFSSTYSWSCEAVTFQEYTKLKRGKNDMMRYA